MKVPLMLPPKWIATLQDALDGLYVEGRDVYFDTSDLARTGTLRVIEVREDSEEITYVSVQYRGRTKRRA